MSGPILVFRPRRADFGPRDPLPDILDPLSQTLLPRTPLPPDRPKCLCFSSLPSHFRSFPLSLWGSSRGILVVFFKAGTSNVHVWARARGRRGFTRQPENSIRANLRVPGASTTSKIPRERERKTAKMERERENTRNFGPPPFGAPPPSGLPLLQSPSPSEPPPGPNPHSDRSHPDRPLEPSSYSRP